MNQFFRLLAAGSGLLAGMVYADPAPAQKQGGVLRMFTIDSPASVSIHEETTAHAERPVMPVFNNLVIFNQHLAQNSLESIVPDLATEWSWNEERTALTFSLSLALQVRAADRR